MTRSGGVIRSPFGDEGAEGEIAAEGETATSVAGDCFRHVCMPVQNPVNTMMQFSVSFEKTQS